MANDLKVNENRMLRSFRLNDDDDEEREGYLTLTILHGMWMKMVYVQDGDRQKQYKRKEYDNTENATIPHTLSNTHGILVRACLESVVQTTVLYSTVLSTRPLHLPHATHFVFKRNLLFLLVFIRSPLFVSTAR